MWGLSWSIQISFSAEGHHVVHHCNCCTVVRAMYARFKRCLCLHVLNKPLNNNLAY